MIDLTQKTVLILGGLHTLSKGIAERLQDLGAAVILYNLTPSPTLPLGGEGSSSIPPGGRFPPLLGVRATGSLPC
jgi:hypothetical protein